MRTKDYERICTECDLIVRRKLMWHDAVKEFNIEDERFYIMIIIINYGLNTASSLISDSKLM